MDGARRMTWAVGVGVIAWWSGTASGATPMAPDSRGAMRHTERVEPAHSGGVDVGGAVSIEETDGQGAERIVTSEPVTAPVVDREPIPAVEASAEKEAAIEAPSGDAASSDAAPASRAALGVNENALDGGDEPVSGALAAHEAMPLGQSAAGGAGQGALSVLSPDGLGIARTVGAVGLVVALILLAKVLLGRAARMGGTGLRGQLGAGGRAPSGIVQILGRYPVSRGHTLVLMKLDRRVLLLSQTAGGFSTLSEITDADDVASILSKSRDEEGESLTARFGALLRRLERDPEMGNADDVEIAPYLRRPSLEDLGEYASDAPVPITDEGIGTDDAGAALRRRLEGLRGLSA